MLADRIKNPVEILQKAVDDAKTRTTEVALIGMFAQVWDTPALGFLGVAAAEDTLAYTTILTSLAPESKTCYVYFDGRYAYTVHNPNQKFSDAIAAGELGSVLYRSDYEIVSTEVDPDSID